MTNRPTTNRTMTVAGVMSGTSADGINVALARIHDTDSPSIGAATPHPAMKLIGYVEYAYPARVRAAVLASMNAAHASVRELARLNVRLGELYAEAVLRAQRKWNVRADLIGCHGQTLYHQGERQPFLASRVSTTWQTGEAAVIAARVGVPVVSDFRPADMAAGGKGAPLVPYFDYLFFRDPLIGRIVQNIGGIANLTAIPANAPTASVVAFDTGPGNMVIDQVVEALFHRPFDRAGKIAASGRVIEPVVKSVLKQSFFRKRPPKTAGREEFGREFVRNFLRRCGRAPLADIVATATALTARSVADAVQQFLILPARKQGSFREMILSGGGTRNQTLVSMLAERLSPLGIRLRFTDELGLPSAAKEAAAFALLAYQTWNRRPSNLPSATGAKRPAVLGKISYA